jgi:hypothetical protein
MTASLARTYCQNARRLSAVSHVHCQRQVERVRGCQSQAKRIADRLSALRTVEDRAVVRADAGHRSRLDDVTAEELEQ